MKLIVTTVTKTTYIGQTKRSNSTRFKEHHILDIKDLKNRMSPSMLTIGHNVALKMLDGTYPILLHILKL